MADQDTHSANSLVAYSMVLLRCGDRYLMLQRGEHKAFAPGRWTGIGGKVEVGEFSDLRSSALREIQEETGILASQVYRLTLRRALLNLRPDHPLTVLLYFTGEIVEPISPDCDEGTLHWLRDDELQNIDIIENTRVVIPLLIDDMRRDPDGAERPITGASTYAPDDEIRSIVWSN